MIRRRSLSGLGMAFLFVLAVSAGEGAGGALFGPRVSDPCDSECSACQESGAVRMSHGEAVLLCPDRDCDGDGNADECDDPPGQRGEEVNGIYVVYQWCRCPTDSANLWPNDCCTAIRRKIGGLKWQAFCDDDIDCPDPCDDKICLADVAQPINGMVNCDCQDPPQ